VNTVSNDFFQDDRLIDTPGREVMADVNRFFSRERLEQAAMQGERLRLARELHDGVLQSLSGAGLQLEALSRLIEVSPEAARERLLAIEKLIADEQRGLRVWIEKLGPSAPASTASGADLAAALEKLRERAQWQWALRVELSVDQRGTVSRILGDEIYRIVQEALTNVGRHAHARVAWVSVKLAVGSGPVQIAVVDDGDGFSFRGRYNLTELTDRRIGPKSLRERVASLRGEMILTSELAGARLEISLPTDHDSPRRPMRNLANG